MILVANDHAPEVVQPGDQPLDFPATAVTTQRSAILRGGSDSVVPVRSDQFNALRRKGLVERVAVVGFVPDEPSGLFGNESSVKGVLGEFGLMRASAGHVSGERKTSAVCHCHELRTFAPLGLSHAEPPFFATTNVPSMKHSDKSKPPRAFRSSASVCNIRSSTPVRTHCWNRLWQVWYGGYRSGMSCQGAPVRNIHRTPLSTSRVSLQGRPRPSARRFGAGINGCKIDHCSSVMSTRHPLVTTIIGGRNHL